MSFPSFKIRIYAFLLDYLLIVVYGVFVVGTISILFPTYISPLFSYSAITAELTGFLLVTLPVSLYFILFESSKWQGTWGKRRMGIQVVDNCGKRIGFGRSVIRTAIKFFPWEVAHFCIYRLILPTDLSEVTVYVLLNGVNLAIISYLIIPLTNQQKKNVYDWIAGTKVVRSDSESNK